MLKTRIVCILLLISIVAAIQSEEPTKVTSYDPGELLSKIFNPNSTITSRQQGYRLAFNTDLPDSPEGKNEQHRLSFHDSKSLKFEVQPQKAVRFEDISNQGTDQDWNQDSGRPLKFEDQRITFQDNNAIDNKNKRRRRRKPKKGFQGRPGFSGLQQGAGQPDFGLRPGFGQDPYVNPGVNPGHVPFRRRRRPRPSLATDALTAVTGALTSIALYDDYQCVPRLMCEAAGGGSLGSGGVLDSIAGIQPLLTLLSAYNGISSSPLFVFGRAVFLGMTSRGNTATCRYAYPQCPTDPEQLIHYLNNHNGGFFRFFNASPNQNLEQFYQHLGQNGQFLGQNQQFSGQGFGPNGYGQNYGYQPGLQGQGNYGLYQSQATGQQGYGFQNVGHEPNLYGQNYGSNYDYNTYGPNNIRYKIEKRIQNKPAGYDDEFGKHDSQWQFPDNIHNDTEDEYRDSLKFPENYGKDEDKSDLKRKGKSILFPENQYNNNAHSNKNYDITNNQITSSSRPFSQNNYHRGTQRPYYHNYNHNQNNVNNNYYKTTATPLNENAYYYDNKHNFYVKKNEYDNNNNNYYNKYLSVDNNKYQRPANYANTNDNYDGSHTVYIVRGNGDPNRPEIVRVRPGQTVT